MRNHHHRWLFIAFTFLFVALHTAKSQTAKQIFSSSGIWQDYGMALNVSSYPEFKGRLVNINWSEFETAPDTWNWEVFDADINLHVIDSLPIIVLVYTGMNAPGWIYNNGVPKVIETSADGSTNTYSPYYLDEDYNVYFKRMITNVRQHIELLPASVRNKIVGIQACFGSTGDQIAYKGAVPENYAITTQQFDSLFKVYSTYYYNEYKNLSPKIAMLSNPSYNDSLQLYWLLENCPGGWLKCGTFAKGSQLNFELQKNGWLYDVLNKPYKGQYVQARCEVVGTQLTAGWWTKNSYREMFAIMCYNIYWGLDWPNQTVDFLQNPKFDSAFAFFNKYAGQKVAATATNALCALKDALDASDSERFSSAEYGSADRYNTQRYKNIHNSFKAYGAKLEDISVVTGSEYASLSAAGTNDVGWLLLPGNYERFLHQINANETSAGYWNIDDKNNDVMYGRYGRGFDISKGKTALYFDLDDSFLRNKPLNSEYPVTIEITYFDDKKGSWQLVYDSQNQSDEVAITINCTNSGTWKKQTITLADAYFGNRGTSGADFYIKNADKDDVIFSTVELSRAAQPDAGIIVSALPGFDTVCVSAVTSPKSFVLNGAALDGRSIFVGPLYGYKFSTSANGDYSRFVRFQNYGTSLNATIYVKQNTDAPGDFSGNIPVYSGGVAVAFIKASSVVSNTSPVLDAALSLVSCNNKKDGAIDLDPKNGKKPFKYKWTNDIQKFWTDSAEDISGLQPGNYTVEVRSGPGCVTSKSYTITQPGPLAVSVSADSIIQCKGGSTTVTVSATGGVQPYDGTGVFPADNGFKSYEVTDANGCKEKQGLTVTNGTGTAPPKPDGINGPTSVSILEANLVYSVENADNSFRYTWTVPEDALITDGQHTSTITVRWGSQKDNISVTASNNCGESNDVSLKVSIAKNVNGEILSSMMTNSPGNSFTPAPVVNKETVLMPNPVTTTATLSFYTEKTYAYSITITDIKGRPLSLTNGMAKPATNLVKLDVSQFAAGVYFITIVHNNGARKTLRMIKQ